MRATLSILGLYNYDNTIFDDMVLPAGVDSGIAVESIITECAELEIMYSDPEWMKELIKMWSTRELPVWERIYNAITLEYNPIENYNRQEDWNQTDTGSSSASGSNTDTGKVTGYNSGDWANQNQTESYVSNSGNSSLQTYHTSNIHGNIGVTTSQQMLNQELDVAPRTDIYIYIVSSFKNRFCLMVY